MIGSLTRWVLRHRLLVVIAWVAVAVGGAVAAGSLGSAFSKQFSIPGKAIATSARIAHEFGAGGQTAPLVGVISSSHQDLASPRAARQAQTAFARMSAAEPGSRLASYETTGDRSFLSPDHHAEFALVFPRGARPRRARPLNDEIAQRLVISPATAKTHVSRTMLKLAARDRAQLVVIAYQTGLVVPNPR
jgi:hypothetical protein